MTSGSLETESRKLRCKGLVAMTSSSPSEILPGCTVTVNDICSIYNGYTGFVQRISGDRAAVLFEGGNWDKLVTLPIKDLNLA